MTLRTGHRRSSSGSRHTNWVIPEDNWKLTVTQSVPVLWLRFVSNLGQDSGVGGSVAGIFPLAALSALRAEGAALAVV